MTPERARLITFVWETIRLQAWTARALRDNRVAVFDAGPVKTKLPPFPIQFQAPDYLYFQIREVEHGTHLVEAIVCEGCEVELVSVRPRPVLARRAAA